MNLQVLKEPEENGGKNAPFNVYLIFSQLGVQLSLGFHHVYYEIYKSNESNPQPTIAKILQTLTPPHNTGVRIVPLL